MAAIDEWDKWYAREAIGETPASPGDLHDATLFGFSRSDGERTVRIGRRAVPGYLQTWRSPKHAQTRGHVGLFFERMGTRWIVERERGRRQEIAAKVVPDKDSWIEAVTGPVGDGDQVRAYADRLKHLAESCGGRSVDIRLTATLAIGLGLPNPTENGVTWHRTLGTPYIPGSGIKGLVQAYAFEWSNDIGDDEASRERALRIFGQWRPNPSAKTNLTGGIAFLDAVPTGPVTIMRDVLTPHQRDYYGDASLPDEMSNPVPVFFAAVKRDAVFRFSFMPTRNGPAAASDLDAVESWLRAALRQMGAGAKTRVGYGRFRP